MTRRYVCVTSMSIPIYEAYGHKMITSWLSSWSHLPASLVVHFNDAPPPDFPSAPNLHASSLRRDFPALYDFQTRHQSPICSGRFGNTYSYRHDARKFAFKVAAVAAEALSNDPANSGADVLIWLDADTLWLKPMDQAFLDRVFPSGTSVATFTRANYHSECGIVFYDLTSLRTIQFIEQYWALYESDRLFTLPAWTDCDALDALAKHFSERYPDFRFANLGTEASQYCGHPIVNSPWAHYVDHLKGNRKESGASYDSDKVLPT